MHFGKQLNLLAYQPWKEYYLNFDLLKKVIKDILKKGKEEGRVLMLGKEEANRMREMKLEGSEGGKDSFSKYLNRKSDNGSSRDDENSIEGVRVPEYRYSNSFDGMEIEDGMEMLFISEFDEPKKTSPEDEDESKSKEEEEKREEVVILTEELTDMFLIALKNERDKVNAFFVSELRKRYKEIEAIERAVQVKKNNNSPLLPLKKRYFDLMVLVEEMIDFARLNLVGFTKIIKKFIRCTDYTKRADLIAEINLSDFVSKGPELDSVKAKITASYTKTFNDPADKSSGLKLEKELEQSVIAARSWKFNTILFQIDEHMNKVTIVPPRKSGGAIPVLIAAILLAVKKIKKHIYTHIYIYNKFVNNIIVSLISLFFIDIPLRSYFP